MEYKKVVKVTKKLDKMDRSDLKNMIFDLIEIANGEIGLLNSREEALEYFAETYNIKEIL